MSFKISHPDIDALGTAASERQFERVLEPRGWRRVDEAAALASEVLGRPVTDVGDARVDELKKLLEARGVEVPKGAKKGALEALLKDSVSATAEPASAPAPADATDNQKG